MENKKTKRWQAQKGERYFLIDSWGDVIGHINDDYEVDNMLFEYGNYFRTRKEALKALEENKKTLMRCHDVLRDFEWALQKMKEGLRVRRSSWGRYYPSHLYIDPTEDNLLVEVRINCNGMFFTSSEACLFSDDVFADDWELYQGERR